MDSLTAKAVPRTFFVCLSLSHRLCLNPSNTHEHSKTKDSCFCLSLGSDEAVLVPDFHLRPARDLSIYQTRNCQNEGAVGGAIKGFDARLKDRRMSEE